MRVLTHYIITSRADADDNGQVLAPAWLNVRTRQHILLFEPPALPALCCGGRAPFLDGLDPLKASTLGNFQRPSYINPYLPPNLGRYLG